MNNDLQRTSWHNHIHSNSRFLAGTSRVFNGRLDGAYTTRGQRRRRVRVVVLVVLGVLTLVLMQLLIACR